MSIRDKFLQFVSALRQSEENDLPPEVSEKANYSYSNFRGLEYSSQGPRYEHREESDSELEVFASGARPQLELCSH